MKQIATQVRLHSSGWGEGGWWWKDFGDMVCSQLLFVMFFELSRLQEYILSGMCGA